MGDRGGTADRGGAGPEAAGAAREPAAGAGVEAAGAMPAAAPGAPAAGSPAWLDEEEMPAWLAFLEVSHLLERAVEQQLKQDAGLSHAQYEILSRLESADGGAMRMSDLADVIIVSRSGLTYQVTQLERAGLVRRGKCPSDERGVLAAVTSAGRAGRRASPAAPPPPPAQLALAILLEGIHELPGRLTTPGVDDQFRELVSVDRWQPDKYRREAVVVRLGEKLCVVGGEQGLLLMPVGYPDGHHVGPGDTGFLWLDALRPDPGEAFLLALVVDGEGEPVLRLAR